jgi:hypothetical protein
MFIAEVIREHMTEITNRRADPTHGVDLTPPPPFEGSP